MSAFVKIIKNPFDEVEEEPVQIKAGTLIKDIKGVDANSVAYVNGKHADNNYQLKNGDVCVIRCFPSATVATGIGIVIGLAVVYGTADSIVASFTGKHIHEHAIDGLKKLFQPSTDGLTNSQEAITMLPSLSGGKNQSAFGKVIPLIMGKTLLTPYYECKMPYNTISGEDGADQYYNCLYLIGYKDVQIENISIGLETLATNSNHVENGDLTITSEKYSRSSHNTQLELRNNGEVQLFPCKVIQDNYNIELLKVQGDNNYSYVFSARYAKKIELEFNLAGLVGYNSKGEQQNASVDISVEYSFDGNTWIDCGNCIDFSHLGTSGAGSEYKSETSTYGIGYIHFQNKKTKTLRYVLRKEFTADEMEGCTTKTVEFRIKRLNASSTETNIIDKIYITAMRTWCYDATKTAEYNEEHPTAKQLIDQAPMISKQRDKTARLGFSIKVSQDLVNNFDKINLVATSKCRTWNGTGWSKTLSATRNPASIALMLLTGDFRNEYRYDIDESGTYFQCSKLNLESFGALYELCETTRADFPSGMNKLYYCDGVVVNATKTIDLVNRVLQCARSYLIMKGNKYGIFTDKVQDYPLFVLNNNNLLDLTYSKNFDIIPDGQSVKYISAINYYQQDTIVVKPLGSGAVSDADKLETLDLPYITDPYHAKAMSLYKQACYKLRPETINAKVTGEGGLAEVGSLVSIQSDRVLVGIGDGAEITELVTSGNIITGIKTDGRFSVTDISNDYGVVINIVDTNGNEKSLRRQLAAFEAVGEYSELTFDQPIGMSAYSKPEVGNIVSFGLYNSEVEDMLCVGKEENGDGTYNLILIPYSPEIFQADSEVIDDFDPKVTPPTEAGTTISYGERTVPASKIDVIELIEESKDMSVPPVPSSVSAVADRDYINVGWQATDDNIGYTQIEISKNSGASWTVVDRIKANTCKYYFKRNVDGYPEASVFSTWSFRLKNVSVNGVESAYVTTSVNSASYGTWIPATPSFSEKIPSEGGITFNWNTPSGSGGKALYGNQRYTVTVKYEDTDHSIAETTFGTVVSNTLSAVYNFNRTRDGYPEVNATSNYKGLSKYKFTLTVTNESGETATSTEVTFSNDELANYKTWIPSTPVIKKKLAEENGISFEWDDVSDCYGSNHYTIAIPDAEGNIPSSLGSTRFYYTFLRSENGVLKDGWPEISDLNSWDFTVTAVNNQTSRDSSATDTVDTSEYLGWTPNSPTVETRSSGRTCTLSPTNADRRYGKIMYKILVCNPATDYVEEGGERVYKYYLPTPTSDPFGDEENYKKTSTVQPQENVPITTDSPYSQTMPLKDQTATTFKRYSFKNDDNPLDYDNGTTKLLVYTDSEPPSGATQNDVYIDGVLIEDAYCWTDTVNALNYISFSVSMPSPKDTIYWWKIASYNAVTESLQSKTTAYVEAQVTAFATSAFDVVKNGITENALAPDAVTTDKIAAGTITANKIFVEALSAISANLGAITDGSLVGNQNNYWYLTDEYSGDQLVHRAGDFRVGGASGDFISCTTSNGTDYFIEIQASQFNITAIGTVVKGAFYVAPSNATIDPTTGIPNSYYARIDSNGVSITGNASVGGTLGVTGNTTLGGSFSISNATHRQNATNALINSLSTGSSDPVDDDYYIAQYAGGGTTYTTYHRRPVKALWNYIKGKIQSIALTIGSATSSIAESLFGSISIKQRVNGSDVVTASITQEGAISGTSANISGAINGKGYIKTWTQLDLSSLDASKWFPCTVPLATQGFNEIECYVSLDSGTKPSWSSHNNGFTCHLHLLTIGGGWGTTSAQTVVLDRQYGFTTVNNVTVNPVGWTQMTNSSTGVLWLRGGGKYRVWNSRNSTFTIRTSNYTVSSQTVSPSTTYQWSFTTAQLWGTLNGSSSSVRDSNNGESTTFAYSKAVLTGNPAWLAAWNGYELRAIAPSQVTSGKSESCTGNAASAYNAQTSKSLSGYVLCNSEGNQKNKTGGCYGYDLKIGARFCLYLQNSNTIAEATLNVGGTGSRAVYINDSPVTASNWTSGYWWMVYDGSVYRASQDLYLVKKYNFTTTGGYIVYSNGLKIQWGTKDRGSNLSAGSAWAGTISSSDGFLAYGNTNYKVFLTYTDNGGGGAEPREVKSSRTTSSFSFSIYNRNSGNTSQSPSLNWLTIGY